MQNRYIVHLGTSWAERIYLGSKNAPLESGLNLCCNYINCFHGMDKFMTIILALDNIIKLAIVNSLS